MILLPWCGESRALCLFPESFTAASSSEVHFNIAPQWKTIKDRIREAYYSANNKKRNILTFYKSFFVEGKKKINNQQSNFSVCLSCVFVLCFCFSRCFILAFVFSLWFLWSQGYAYGGIFFFYRTYFMNNLSHMFHCVTAEALVRLTMRIDLQSYKSWRFATEVFLSFLLLQFL